jgi:energy-coupling factor transport system permease protein
MFSFVNGNSWLHRLDPLAKITAVAIMLSLALLSEDTVFLGIAGFLLFVAAKTARIPSGISKGSILMLGIAGLLQYSVMGRWEIALRLWVMASLGNIFSCTTSPSKFALSLERLHLPFPVLFVISTSFRFIPMLEEEFERISEAQEARGLTGNPIRKFLPLAIPLIRATFLRAHELALSLESRGFGRSFGLKTHKNI